MKIFRTGLWPTLEGCQFVIADFTRQSGGVYFEAGYSAPLILPAFGRLVGFLDQFLPPFSQPLQGILRITTTSSGISVIGLRTRYNERGDYLFTTTSPTLENAATDSTEQVFPHLADGGGYTTQFILFSGSASQITSGGIRVLDQSGRSLDLGLR